MSTVTIVTRTKDRPVLLARAIKSVLGQSHENWEHIIVNDGGNRDGVEKLVAKNEAAYRKRVRVLHHDTPLGMQQAANKGVAAGNGVYICIHDDDDSWDAQFLASSIEFLENKGPESRYQGVIAHSELVEETIGPRGKITVKSTRPYVPLDEINLFRVGFENPFPPIAFCFRRSAFEQIGAFDPQFNVAGDYDFNFRFLRQFEIGVIEDVHAFYHVRIDPRNEAEGNSVQLAAREHKIRYNELKNHYLRHAENDQDAALALAFNTARYLVEIEWATHETRERTQTIQKTLDQSTRAIDARITASEQRMEEVLAPEATRAYREDLLALLNTLTERSEEHAGNLWNDLNARTRETADAIANMQTALIDRHERIQEALRSAANGVGQESSLLALRERLDALSAQTGQEATLHTLIERVNTLSEGMDKASRDLWTDLNARARENVAAIEANAEQRTEDLHNLQSAHEASSALQGQAIEALPARIAPELENLRASLSQQLTAAANAQAQDRQVVSDSLSKLAEGLETVSQNLITLEAGMKSERAARRSLFSLGRLGLFWERHSAVTETPVSPDA